MGAIRRLVLLAHSMIRMLDMYFSIVRRRAACASRDRESASLIITTTYLQWDGCEYSPYRCLVYIQTFEPLFGVEINLLSLRYLFKEFLDNNSVEIASLATTAMPISEVFPVRWKIVRVTNLGVISMWKLLCTIFTSSFRFDGDRNTR
jgi:hypothetical protein